MSRIYLPATASRARMKEAAAARENRLEIVRALSWGQVSRRELLKYGLFTGAGMLAPIRGLSPFASSVYASDGGIPTGAPPSPMFGVKPFTQPMLRFDVLPRTPVSLLNPEPMEQANQTQQPCDPILGGGMGPVEGRPPGPLWGHQDFRRFPPSIAVEVTQEGARSNAIYNPGCEAQFNSGYNPADGCRPCFTRPSRTRRPARYGRSTARYRRNC